MRFATAEQAQRAVDGMNEKKYVWTGSSDGNGSDSPNDNNAAKPISCKLADKADPRRRANGASMGTGTIAAGPSSSPSAGPLRGKFHNSRHHNQQQQTQTGQVSLQQQLICNDLHLHNHHQPMAAAISALSSKHQLPPGVIYPHSESNCARILFHFLNTCPGRCFDITLGNFLTSHMIWFVPARG